MYTVFQLAANQDSDLQFSPHSFFIIIFGLAQNICLPPHPHVFAHPCTGSFQVVDSTTLDDIIGFHHRKEEISDIKFSPGKPIISGNILKL